MIRQRRLHHVAAVLMLVALSSSALVALVATPLPIRTASAATATNTLYDDFTHDSSLNTNLWQVNGSVGTLYGPQDVGSIAAVIPLIPTFSSLGMGIDQANKSFVVGTIQSVSSFAPPFTATAVVEGTISHGHTFGFAISSEDTSAGVAIIGNLNSTDCSALGNCGDPTTCGTSANPSTIPASQCYYGIYPKVANGTAWVKQPKLVLTPSVDVVYTVQISVDASGSAHFSVSAEGQVLGESSAHVGNGPFYIIMEQAEGAPVPGHGPNQAYWMSVSMSPTTATSTTTSTTSSTTTSPGSSPGPGGFPIVFLFLTALALFLILIILLWYSRRRKFTVKVVDSRALSPISQATVLADGPENLSGVTGNDGKVDFGGPKEGDYSVRASAAGYLASAPLTVSVKKSTECTVKLDRAASAAQQGVGVGTPPAGPGGGLATGLGEVEAVPTPPARQPQAGAVPPSQQGTAPTMARPEPAEMEGWGGERIRQIIKTFQEKGAISPETALTAEELGLSRLFVRIMKRRKGKTMVFIEVNGKYYLNQDALRDAK